MNKIKNKFKRLKDEIRVFVKLSLNLGFFNGLLIIIGKIINHHLNKTGKKESKLETKLLMKKHQLIEKYIIDTYDDFILNYNYKSRKKNTKMDNTIWICWWQGIDNAPEIVKICVNRIKTNFKNYNVVIIDDSNYKNYITVPKWLEEKKRKQQISKTHFSDYLRIELLAEHGGIWIDSTFYCLDNIDFELFNKDIWSIKRPDYGHLSPACGQFANYSLGCKYDKKKFFEVLSDYLTYYWKNNNYIIDYLLTDYLIKIILDRNEEFQEQFNNIPSNNANCDELFKILGENFDEKKWNEIKKDTFFFKLSWKHSFNKKNKNIETFYSKILKNEL